MKQRNIRFGTSSGAIIRATPIETVSDAATRIALTRLRLFREIWMPRTIQRRETQRQQVSPSAIAILEHILGRPIQEPASRQTAVVATAPIASSTVERSISSAHRLSQQTDSDQTAATQMSKISRASVATLRAIDED